jgi:hypothetical protein
MTGKTYTNIELANACMLECFKCNKTEKTDTKINKLPTGWTRKSLDKAKDYPSQERENRVILLCDKCKKE